MGAVDRHPVAGGFRALVTRLVDDNGPGGRARAMFNMGLGLLIFVNVATVILESVEPLRERFEFWFLLSEQVATGVFAIEYCLRVWTSIDLREAPSRHPVWGRLAYMRGPLPLIDLVAVLPALIGLFGAADLRVLRLMRLMRMLKLTRRLQIFNLLGAVIRDEARSILALPTLAERRAWLRDIERIRGIAAADQLLDTMDRLWREAAKQGRPP